MLPAWPQRTGEQLLQMVKQLVFHGCGIMNSHEWYGYATTQRPACHLGVPPQGGPCVLVEMGRLPVEEQLHR